jgi:hypothetical protein
VHVADKQVKPSAEHPHQGDRQVREILIKTNCMKKIIFVFAAMFIFAVTSNAAGSMPALSQLSISKTAKHVIDLGDVTGKSDQEVKDAIASGLANIEDDDLECTVTLHGSVKAFFLTVEFTITVKGSCSEMIEKGINVSGLVWAAVRAKLMSF